MGGIVFLSRRVVRVAMMGRLAFFAQARLFLVTRDRGYKEGMVMRQACWNPRYALCGAET
jgi:hypothetical protein